MRLLCVLVLTAAFWPFAAPAEAAMYKCVTRDGTVLFQARPCSDGDKELAASGSVAPSGASAPAESPRRKLADNDPRLQALQSPRNAEERAVMDRDVAQRRDRCRVAREMVVRQQSLLASSNEVARHQAGNEIKVQERRMLDDGCAAL